MRKDVFRWVTIAALGAVGWVGCVGDSMLDLDSGGIDAGSDATTDAPKQDSSTQDSSTTSDASDGGASTDGDASFSYTYADWSSISNWESTSVTIGNKISNGLLGAAFDGQYIYFPAASAQQTDGGISQSTFFRYDTTASFTSLTAWSEFDISVLSGSANARDYRGAVVLGQYVYFCPGNTSAPQGNFVRYDTKGGGFTSASAWTIYDVQAGSADAAGQNLNGYVGGVTDGTYVYFAPFHDTTADHGRVLRYDPSGGFTNASSWKVFDLTALAANAVAYRGALFDGKYVYFVPGANTSNNAVAARYDTTGSFTSSSSWEVYNLANVDTNAVGFWGGVFDGRYAYYIPYGNPGSYRHTLVRFDTQAVSLSTASAWSVFDLATYPQDAGFTIQGYLSGAFDGRYVYVSGYASSSRTMRYDTTAPFANATSWSMFDTTKVQAGNDIYGGTVFDGQYVYFSPGQGPAYFARFAARTPSGPITPAEYHGSFF